MKKNKIKLAALLFMLGMTSGCGETTKEYSKKTTYEYKTEYQTDEYNNKEEIFDELSYKDYFDNVELKYNIEDFYPSKNELNNFINKKKENCTYKNKVNYKKDPTEIFDKIISNTEEYIKDHPEYKDPFIYSEIDDLPSWTHIHTALFTNIVDIFNNSTNDVYEDICKMQDLVVVFSKIPSDEDEIVYAQYDSIQNLLLINYDSFVELTKGDYYEFDQTEQLLRHELNHLRQTACSCAKTPYECIQYQEDNVPFFIESSAESATYNEKYSKYNSDIDYCYPRERKMESKILLLSLFGNNNIDDYYNAMFDCDFQKLYDFLNLKNDDEIYKFWKIIYSYDATLLRNDSVINYFKSQGNIPENATYGEIQNIVGFTHDLELYNMLLSKMVEYTINNKDFDMDNNLEMLNFIDCYIVENKVFKEDLESDIEISNIEYFNDNFKKSRDKYIEFITKHYDNQELTNYGYIKNKDRFPILEYIKEPFSYNTLKEYFEKYNIDSNENSDIKSLQYNR